MEWLKMVLAAIVICPVAILFVLFFVFSRFKIKKVYAFGFAADVTTVFLFVSVPLIIKSIWDVNVYILVLVVAIVIAIVFTYMEWRKSKEIYIPQLLKRIWRMYFILLIGLYIGLLIMGMVVYIIRFMQ